MAMTAESRAGDVGSVGRSNFGNPGHCHRRYRDRHERSRYLVRSSGSALFWSALAGSTSDYYSQRGGKPKRREQQMNERVKHYGVVTPDILNSYDGLDFLKAIIDETLPQPPITEALGF
jgi:hypothetical protein